MSGSIKRPRIDKQSINADDDEVKRKLQWVALKEWIRENGGDVHDGLDWNAKQRQVATTSSLSKGTKVAKIPSKCLLSLQTLQKYDETSSENSGEYEADAALAWALAHARWSKSSTTMSDGSKELDSTNISPFEPYFATLPESFEHLPRYWPAETRDKLLGGSPLLNRIQNQNIKEKYDKQKQQQQRKHSSKSNDDKSDNDKFPTLEQFDYMMAAISSRAFGGLVKRRDSTPEEELDCLCPFLDLLDHCRGSSGSASGPKKNVKYYVNKRTEGEGGDDDNDALIVELIDDLPANTTLRDTYGARGNGQLLINYGFCIPNNIEPDGSCNDVLDFHYEGEDSSSMVELRLGPKSYTYGPFVKALELFYDRPQQPTSQRKTRTDPALPWHWCRTMTEHPPPSWPGCHPSPS